MLSYRHAMARKVLHQPSSLETMPNFYQVFVPSIIVVVVIPAIVAVHCYWPRFFPGLRNTIRNAVGRLYTYVQQRWTQRTSQGQQNNNAANAPDAQAVNTSTQPPPAVASSQQTSNAGPSATNQTLPRDGIELQRHADTGDISEPSPFEPPPLIYQPHQLDESPEAADSSERTGTQSTNHLDIEEWRDF